MFVSQVGGGMEALPGSVVAGVIQVLEERAIGAGTVTRDGLKDHLNDVLKDSGLLATVDRLVGLCSEGRPNPNPVEGRNENDAEAGNAGDGDGHGFRPFCWGGHLRRVRQDFTFPKGGPLTAWIFYLCGDGTKGYPPYRSNYLRPPLPLRMGSGETRVFHTWYSFLKISTLGMLCDGESAPCCIQKAY
jgi:hypothetical protein